MNSREIEHLEKKSIYSIRMNDDLKESVIKSYLDELNRVVKKNSRRNNLIVFVLKVD